MEIWKYGNMELWKYGNMEILKNGKWKYGNVEKWEMEIRKNGNMEIWKFGNMQIWHKDSVERFDDFRRRKSRRNDDFRGRFYGVTELAFFGAEN